MENINVVITTNIICHYNVQTFVYNNKYFIDFNDLRVSGMSTEFSFAPQSILWIQDQCYTWTNNNAKDCQPRDGVILHFIGCEDGGGKYIGIQSLSLKECKNLYISIIIILQSQLILHKFYAHYNVYVPHIHVQLYYLTCKSIG